MKNSKEDRVLLLRIISHLKAMFYIFVDEVKNIFKDRGVMILVVVAVLAYPLLYCSLYINETLVDVPVAVVDASRTPRSAEFIRHLDATRDVSVTDKPATMQEAQQAFNEGKVHGVIYLPADFDKKINKGEQAVVSVYSDMSSFLYYRAMVLSTNYVSLDMGKEIQINRLNAIGVTGEQQAIVSDPIPYKSVILYNEGMGFASFLMPAILILIIHQTLFFGIGMAAGTAREENRFHELVSSSVHRGGTFRVILGKALAFFSLYLLWSVYLLGFIPWLFNLPHIGNPFTLLEFVVPFLLATIFFSMTASVFVPSREIQMVLLLFFSLILLFLSGISWPQSAISGVWKVFSWLFPATFGIQAYFKINTMGASIHEVGFEQIGLWIQTAVYFITTLLAYRWQLKKHINKKEE
ncbi:MAG: ABC transporter permease [Paludibacter sp.]|nr:ABC transporter permease [Paludibacter sp.]